jgi:hypothetical protein
MTHLISSGRLGFRAPGSTTGVLPGQGKQEFYTGFMPELWKELIAVFAHTVNYHYIEGGSVEIEALVYEGMEGESRTPGQYTHVMVDNATLERIPMAGDWLELEGKSYDVVTVDALLVNLSRLVVHGQRV